MIKKIPSKTVSRRDFMKLAGGVLAAAAGAYALPKILRNPLNPVKAVQAQPDDPYDLYFGGTDGWASMPASSPAIPPFWPDDLAPDPLNLYIFGFRNVTGLTNEQMLNQKNRAQFVSPIFWLDQFNPDPLLSYPNNNEFRLKLTNLGLAMRPDLIDAHTLHFHGLRNVIPYFDGEPMSSISVPIGSNLIYVYRAYEPGTYMYHCHVEDVEHVEMGMIGPVFVRPAQNGTNIGGFTKFAYNDGDGSTGYHREFAMLLTDVWAESHWTGSHVQAPEWSDYHPDFTLINGRSYPDTLAPSSAFNVFDHLPELQPTGDLQINPGYEHLQYQPYSSLVECNAGERVLLRFANLGFKPAAMTLAGIPMHVIGKDATIMRGRDGTDTSYYTNTEMIVAGEGKDVIFEAPAHSCNAGYDTYLLYNRSYNRAGNLSPEGFNGQMTEVHVFPAGTLPPQTIPHTLPQP
jgi:FtsP/CotA-like multicopper oxidase with cupredoxin domain